MTRTNRRALAKRIKTYRALGVILALFSVAILVATAYIILFENGSLFELSAWSLIFICIALAFFGWGCFLNIKTHRTIFEMVDSGEYSIVSIAAEINRKEKFTENYLKDMIKQNIFPGAGIDPETKTLVLREVVPDINEPDRGEHIIAVCPVCNGKTPSFDGNPVRCYYCGITIRVKNK